MPQCFRCGNTTQSTDVRCKTCGAALKAFGDAGIDLHRATGISPFVIPVFITQMTHVTTKNAPTYRIAHCIGISIDPSSKSGVPVPESRDRPIPCC